MNYAANVCAAKVEIQKYLAGFTGLTGVDVKV